MLKFIPTYAYNQHIDKWKRIDIPETDLTV